MPRSFHKSSMLFSHAHSLAASLKQLVRSWWQQDRIRIGRSCGQLLSLHVGDRLVIDDAIFVVVKRWTDKSSPVQATNTVPDWERPWNEWLHLDPVNEEKQYAVGNNGNSVLADDTTDIHGSQAVAKGEEWFDEPASEPVPTYVEYLLREGSDEHEAVSNTWSNTLPHQSSFSTGEKQLCELARLIVPIATTHAIRFHRGQTKRELLSEEIAIVPGSSARENTLHVK